MQLASPPLPAEWVQTLDNKIHIYQGPYTTRILRHYAHNGSQSSIKESKWFRKIEESRSFAFKQEAAEELVTQVPSGI